MSYEIRLEIRLYPIMWLEKKYISLLSSNLQLFKSVGDNTWNFRCPICEDSKKHKSKARGYILFGNGKYYSYCHNCHASYSFYEFLQKINPILHKEYIYEKYNNEPKKKLEQHSIIDRKKTVANFILTSLKKISQLKPNHPAKKLVVRRMIPNFFHSRLYYARNFNRFANKLVDDKFDPKIVEPRIVIPMLDQHRKLIGVQGRTIAWNVDHHYRYMTCMLAPDNMRFFGMDLVNLATTYYVLEGPFDSMFLKNAIAVCGGAIHSELKKHNLPKATGVVVYDNEPRNKDIIKNMMKVVRRGYKICVWPPNIKEKDINDMVLALVPPFDNMIQTELVQGAGAYIQDTIDSNTYEGLEAESRILEWSRV